MVRALCTVAVLLLVLVESADATTILFNTNPLTGNPALITPGRQIVPPAGSEPFLTFNPATDVIALDPAAFGVGVFGFANGLSTSLPMTGVNFIVLQNGAPLAAGTAADAIANQLTQDAPGFFIYFNSGLQLPRLVYSTNLNDQNADLAVLARFTNLSGPAGFAALSTVTAANVNVVPEPSSLLLTCVGALLVGARVWRVRNSVR